MADSSLAYVGIEARSLDAWSRFLGDGIGVPLSRDGGLLVGRLDDRARRLLLREGPRDDVSFVGWECASEADAEARLASFHARGAPVRRGTNAEADERGVAGFFALRERNGLTFELAWGARRITPPEMPLVRDGFVAGDHGLGHIALMTDDLDASTHDYEGLLSARLSDHIDHRELGMPMRIRFLHVNPRHHSLAIVRSALPINPLPRSIHHMMIQMASGADVEAAYGRLLGLGFAMARTIGQHPNDRVTSFYARSPSTFEFEVGSGSIDIDDATWVPREYRGISISGHHVRSVPVGEMLRATVQRLVKGGL
jgi:2,3-dihydroxybiphenyl 1,2-dioxygenase